MANPTRILFVAGEVEPFASVSETAQLVRDLPERLQETGEVEARIMMPRYGTISERKNRLHEVIRLSGTVVPMGDTTETLKVKVASIPGLRLQVYFMDNNRFFKRKGLHEGRAGEAFEDNAERALFFGRSVLETLRKLSWRPDVIHAFGWISGLLPLLLKVEYAAVPLFETAKIVYTPDGIEANASLTSKLVKSMRLPVNGEVTGKTLSQIGIAYADAVVFPATVEPTWAGASQFPLGKDELVQDMLALYDQTRSEVVV